MKILEKNYRHGIIEFIPDCIDDLYAIYRILKVGDYVRTVTTRRIKKGDEDGRADSGERVKMTLEVEVEEFAFHGFGDNLRIKGKIIAGPEELISLGSYHSVSLTLLEKVRLTKKQWTPMEKQIIEDIEESSMLSQILIITMDEESACVTFVTQFSVNILTEYNSSMTRKFSDLKQHSTEKGNYYKDLYQVITDTLTQYQTETVILAGPGFAPEEFLDFVKKRDKTLSDKIQFVHANSGGRVGLHEVLSKKIPEKIATEQRVVYETRLLDEMFKRIGQETNDFTYGLANIKKALEIGAIDTLMISDDLLRIDDIERRELIDELVEKNSEMKGKTVIFSMQHDTGKQLSTLGGVAALLRFPMPDY